MPAGAEVIGKKKFYFFVGKCQKKVYTLYIGGNHLQVNMGKIEMENEISFICGVIFLAVSNVVMLLWISKYSNLK